MARLVAKRALRAAAWAMLIASSAPIAVLAQAQSAADANAPTPAAAPAASPVARHGALAVKGNQIVDQHGAPVTLRGMSLFWSQWEPEYYTRATVDWLVDDWKISLVRVAIAAESDDSARQQFDREFAKASTVIDAAIARGVYVIVDWHAHQPYPADAKRFLTAIARKYGKYPNVIYEPWNEPLRDNISWAGDIRPYHVDVISAIRAIDPDNLVVAGTRSWSQDVDEAAEAPLPFSNVAYTLHYYAATHKAELRAKADIARAKGLALFVTEYGTVSADGNGAVDLAESQAWWDWMEEHGISHANWSVADKDEGSATLRPGTPAARWSAGQLTASGKLVRDRLRSAASPSAPR